MRGPNLSPRGAPGETRTHDLQLRSCGEKRQAEEMTDAAPRRRGRFGTDLAPESQTKSQTRIASMRLVDVTRSLSVGTDIARGRVPPAVGAISQSQTEYALGGVEDHTGSSGGAR